MKKETSSSLLKQVSLAACSSLGYMTVGLVRGYSSPAVPSMMALSPHLVPDKQISSWICAGPPLGAMIGSLLSYPLLEMMGRKRTLLVASPFFAASWLAIALSTNWKMLLAARLASGVCGGLILPAAQIYVSECCRHKVRGTMSTLPSLFLSIGILASYLIGWWLPWNWLAIVSACLPAVMFILLLPLPESPCWLQLIGEYEKASQAAAWLNMSISDLNKSSEAGIPGKEIHKPSLGSREILRPFLVVVTLFVLQQLSGIDVVIFYTVSIFRMATMSRKIDMNRDDPATDDGYAFTSIVGAVATLALGVSLILIDKCGRRPLLVISGLLMTVSMAALAVYFYEVEKGTDVNSLRYLPLISLIVFTSGYAVGYGPIPSVLMGEMLPLSRRSILSAISSSANLGTMFLTVKLYPDLQSLLGKLYPVFSIYSGTSLIATVFAAVFLPETKGKTFQEIEAIFSGKPVVIEERYIQKSPDETIKK